ncbi:MAG: hypothetical protein ACP5IL_10835 [Syntrophobacteraceae bacterium]
MSTKKRIVIAVIALAFLTIMTSGPAKAQCCYNPLLLPFAVAGAAIGTAAAIVSAPFQPYYAYAPPPPPAYYYQTPAPYYSRAWMPGHYTPYGAWIPGHWMYR